MLIPPPARIGARVLTAVLVVAAVLTLVPLLPAAVETFSAEGQDIPSDDYPGKEDGFERGIDANGTEVYRYEYNNQVLSQYPKARVRTPIPIRTPSHHLAVRCTSYLPSSTMAGARSTTTARSHRASCRSCCSPTCTR